MTLDTRAHRAAQGIRRAVEVMEMSRTTKEPTKLEPFHRYVDRKQRNRRRGAILVTAALVVAAIVIGREALDRGQTLVPVQEPEDSTSIERTHFGTLTQSERQCTLDLADSSLSAGVGSLTFVNESDSLVSFDLYQLLARPDLTFEEFEAAVRKERRLAERGKPFIGPPRGASRVGYLIEVRPGKSATIDVALLAATYAVVCLHEYESVGMRPFDLVGPIVVE